MSDQPGQPVQSTQSPEGLRQLMLEQLDASKQAIEELSDEELENVAGGGISGLLNVAKKVPTEYKAVAGFISVSGGLTVLMSAASRNTPTYKSRNSR